MIIGIDGRRAQELGLSPEEVERQVSRGFISIMSNHGNVVRMYRWVDGSLEIDIDAGISISPYFIREGLVTQETPSGRRNPISLCYFGQGCTQGCGCRCALDKGLIEQRYPTADHVPCL